MPRRAAVERAIKLTTTIPETQRAKLDLLLFSEAEGRVPYGAYQKFILARIEEFCSREVIDTPFGIVYGDRETIAKLQQFISENT